MRYFIVLLVLLLTSCSKIQLKLQERQVDNITRNNPQLILEKCAVFYKPIVYDSVRWELIPGIPIVIFDTFRVDCDSIVRKYNQEVETGTITTDPKNVKLLLPTKLVKDSIKQIHEVGYEANFTADKLRAENKDLQIKVAKLQGAKDVFMWTAIIEFILLVILIVIMVFLIKV